MELIARTEYMAGDARDPVACSLFYFALGKHKLVHGLWRQAAWHKEQTVMIKFLSNDFEQPRWRTAALKNAYALLSKRRFGMHNPFSFTKHSIQREFIRICGRVLHSWWQFERCRECLPSSSERLSVGRRSGACC